MPLFAGKVRIKDEVQEIPVWAKSEAAALNYLNSTDEWIGDGVFFELLKGNEDAPAVIGVVEILDPRMSPFTGQTICWHDADPMDEISVGAAFYDSQLYQTEAKLNDRETRLDMLRANAEVNAVFEEKALEKAWEAYFFLEKQFVEKFDQIRFDGVDLDQALLLGNGTSDGGLIDPAKMQAVARVLANEVEELKMTLSKIEWSIRLQ